MFWSSQFWPFSPRNLVLVRPGIAGATLSRIARIDGAYGALSLAVIAVGICRVIWGAKGWEAYVYNVWFWHKMGAFVLVGLLSIPPTMRFIRWRRSLDADSSYVLSESDIRGVRRYLHAEACIFLLIPIFAAAMSRGYGY